MRTSEARKRDEPALCAHPGCGEPIDAVVHHPVPAFVRREAERLGLTDRILTALRRVYGDADYSEASSLRDALEDEGVLP